jgi:MFS family permease
MRTRRRPDGALVAYFVAFLVGEAAVQIEAVAVGWSVYQIEHRPIDLGLVGLALFLPSLLLVLVTGTVVDRLNRKAIVIAASAAELTGAALLAWFASAGHVRLDATLAVVAGIGIARAFGQTAERTILIGIVDDDRYVSVNALYSSTREVAVIGGPALGGVLVAFSPAIAFAAAAALLAIAIVAFAFVRLRRVVAAVDRPSWRSALEGLRFVRAQPVLFGAISLDLFAVLFGGATALLPVYANDILHVGAVGFGLLRSASSVGAFVTALILHRRPPTRRIGAVLLTAVAGYGIATLVFAFARDLWLAFLALAAAGAFDMVSVVIRSGLVALNTPDAMRGRVSAIEMLFIGGSSDLGAFESGTLAQLIGAVGSVAAGGLATLAVVAIWAMVFPTLARSDRLVADA